MGHSVLIKLNEGFIVAFRYFFKCKCQDSSSLFSYKIKMNFLIEK